MPHPIFQNPVWLQLAPYASLRTDHRGVDFLQPPAALHALALSIKSQCVACQKPISPFRIRKQANPIARASSDPAKPARIRVAGTATEKRLFYSGTCATDQDSGCYKTDLAKEHQDEVQAFFNQPLTVRKKRGQKKREKLAHLQVLEAVYNRLHDLQEPLREDLFKTIEWMEKNK